MGALCNWADRAGGAIGARMTPELEQALAPIGWRAEHWPEWFASWIESQLKIASSLNAEADKQTLLHSAFVSAFDLRNALLALPDEVRREVSRSAEAYAKLEVGQHDITLFGKAQWDLVPETSSLLYHLMMGLEAQRDLSLKRVPPQRRGGRSNYRARKVARIVARVFVAGLGERPTIGRRSDGTGASGKFGQALEHVLTVLGVYCSDVFPPGIDAINSIDEEEMEGLLALADPSTAGAVSIRMVRMPRPR